MNVLDTMKQALEALELLNDTSIGTHAVALPAEIDTAMDALRAAIAEMEKAEPVAWMRDMNLGRVFAVKPYEHRKTDIPLYTHPTPAVPEGEKCVWTLDNTDCFYHTSCDNAFVLNDGTPAENDMKFCPYCGKTIKEEVEQPWEDEEGEK